MSAIPPAHAACECNVSIGEAARVWLQIALLSFGGPAGQIAVMHRIVVEEKKWASEDRFLHALNYCMLLPGPEAQQLATYLGWLMHGTRGGVLAGGLFILPGAIAVMALSAIYAVFGSIGLVAAAFFSLKAAVLAIVLQAVRRLGQKALKTALLRWLSVAAFVAIFFFAIPFPIVVGAAAAIGFIFARFGKSELVGARNLQADSHPRASGDSFETARASFAGSLRVASTWLAVWLTPLALTWLYLGAGNVFTQIPAFFSRVAVVTFGGAYAALAYVAQQAVEHFHWLQPGEMLDGLGMAETTPGPLIMVLQFVGFMAAYRQPGALSPLVAGVLGGLLASWATFTPCFLWIFVGAPYIERLRGNIALTGALSAVTAAVVGVIVNLAVWFSIHAIFRQTIAIRSFGLSFDFPAVESVNMFALLLSAAAILAVFRFGAGLFQTLAGCSIVGVALYLSGMIGH